MSQSRSIATKWLSPLNAAVVISRGRETKRKSVSGRSRSFLNLREEFMPESVKIFPGMMSWNEMIGARPCFLYAERTFLHSHREGTKSSAGSAEASRAP